MSLPQWGQRTVVAPISDINGDGASDMLIWDPDKWGLWTWTMSGAPTSLGTFSNVGVLAQML